jgi:tetratricopeptide (TPR) repeat protein
VVNARGLVAALSLTACCGVVSAAESVQALRYGVSLYHFFQQDYFSSLSELMVGQKTNELGVHAENAELLRGGMSLSYGMDFQAERIFTEFLSQSQPHADTGRAWFYLGKIAYQRGQLERAATSLQRAGMLADSGLNQELNYLQSSIKLRQGNYPAAEEFLARLPADSLWQPYHYYNMGATRAAAGDWAGATGYFREFSNLSIDGEEEKSLRDRAYTASGFAAIAAGDYVGASHDFSRVRLHSPLSDRALLGYGWAASSQLDFQQALSPWLALSRKPAVSSSVRESLLAVPYAYEQLQLESVALGRYEQAADTYEQQLQLVNQTIARFSVEDLQDLLGLRGDGRESWLFAGDILPVNSSSPYLQELVSSQGFQIAMMELRDLHHIDQRLVTAADRLAVLAIVDQEQQRSWDGIIEEQRAVVLRQRKDDLQKELHILQEKIESVASNEDTRGLTTAQQLTLWARLERALALSETLEKQEDYQFRLDLYRGLLLWQDSEQYAANLWQNQRQIKELQTLLRQAEDGLERLQHTQAQRVQSSYASEISELQNRLQTQGQQLQLAIAASGGELRRLAITELEGQAQALSRSLGQSRLAIARLYDQGSTGAAQ